VLWLRGRTSGINQEERVEVRPEYGTIEVAVNTYGTVEPQNRLEIKPPIGGRIEEVLVEEGEDVKAGQILAWMSSSERAALLDVAKAQGEETLKYWEDVYKPTPIIAPADGKVIVRGVEPGQMVNSADTIFVISDRLIVRANVDEVDIGLVNLGQKAVITLDAYPDINVEGLVDHIAFESEVVNNVTMYKVEILPLEVPEIFRAGMSANVKIITQRKENVLTIPLDAVIEENGEKYVLVSKGEGEKPEKRKIETGIHDGTNIEVISGLTREEKVIMVVQQTSASVENSPRRPPRPPRF